MKFRISLVAMLLIVAISTIANAQEERVYVDISGMSPANQQALLEIVERMNSGQNSDLHLEIRGSQVSVFPFVLKRVGDEPTDPDEPDGEDPTMQQFKNAVKTASDKVPDDSKKDVAKMLRSLVQQDYDNVGILKQAVNTFVGLLTTDDKWDTWLEEVEAAIQSAGYSSVSEVKAAYVAAADVLEGE